MKASIELRALTHSQNLVLVDDDDDDDGWTDDDVIVPREDLTMSWFPGDEQLFRFPTCNL